MKKLIPSIFLILTFCVSPKVTLHCPASTEYKKFKGKKFNLEIEIKDKTFIAPADLFENPPQFEIKRCFIKFMESKGFLYDDSLYDYFIEMRVDTFGIGYEVPAEIRIIGTILGISGIVGTIMTYIGIYKLFDAAWNYAKDGNKGLNFLKVAVILTIPYILFLNIEQFIKYKYKGILSADIQIYSKNKKIFGKYYYIILHKKSQSRNISNPSFLSSYFSEILNKFFSDFEKDLNQKIIMDF